MRYYLIFPIALSVEKKGVDAVRRVSTFPSVTLSTLRICIIIEKRILIVLITQVMYSESNTFFHVFFNDEGRGNK